MTVLVSPAQMILKEMLGAAPSLEHAASVSAYWISHSSPSIAANGMQDAQGRQVALRKAFPLHQLLHTLTAFDVLLGPSGFPKAIGKTMAVRLAEPAKSNASDRNNTQGEERGRSYAKQGRCRWNPHAE